MGTNIYDMLASLAETLPSLTSLAMVFSYLAGLAFVIGALYKLRTYGDFRVMMFQGVDLKGPFGQIVFGSFLIWLPSTLERVSATFWGVGDPLGYDPVTGSLYDQTIALCMDIISFVGIVAFIRGLIIMARLGQQSAQPGTLGKGMTHIVGGIMAYHIGPTVDIIRNTLSI